MNLLGEKISQGWDYDGMQIPLIPFTRRPVNDRVFPAKRFIDPKKLPKSLYRERWNWRIYRTITLETVRVLRENT